MFKFWKQLSNCIFTEQLVGHQNADSDKGLEIYYWWMGDRSKVQKRLLKLLFLTPAISSVFWLNMECVLLFNKESKPSIKSKEAHLVEPVYLLFTPK